MKSVNSEIKKVVGKVKEAQAQLNTLVNSQDWMDEAKKYVERQSKEVKKLFAPDVEKIKTYLERERKELERIQKMIPGEVKKLKKFVELQKKEFEKLLVNVRSLPKTGKSGKAKKTKSSGAKKTKTVRTKKGSAQGASAAGPSESTASN